MKRLLCFFLVFLFATALLTGCQQNDSLIGSWNTQINVLDILKALNIQPPESIEDQMVGATLTFQEDGSFSLVPSQEDLDALAKQLTSDILGDLGSSLGGIFSLFGVSTDSFTLDKDLGEKLTLNGFFKVTENSLYLYKEQDSKLPTAQIDFTLQGNTLTLNKHTSTNPFAVENIFFRALPMTFTKA